MTLFANNSALQSWLPVAKDSDFPIQNIPFGVFRTADKSPRLATIIGDTVIDLQALATLGIFDQLGVPASVFAQPVINDFMALGKAKTLAVRDAIARIMEKDNALLRDNEAARAAILHPVSTVQLLMPVRVGDYTDFYSSREHATNAGLMFRDPANALLPNWLHLPVGYHGRASSIVVSGTPVRRPKGQTMPKGSDKPIFGASQRLDFELEMAFVIGKATQLGDSISTAEADNYIFGLQLFNDWSARDIQQWEYVPLGPFLAKNFASTVSAWVVVLEALEGLRVPTPTPDFEPLPYLRYEGNRNYDIQLEVSIQPENSTESTVCRSNFKYMYWNMAQQLAHHTVNGCNVNVGDMCASGTISGKTPDSYGSMLELAWGGTKTVQLADGSERKFLLDNDTITLRGYGITPDGIRIGFGEATGTILPATL